MTAFDVHSPKKQHIQRAFDQAASAYAEIAQIQQHICYLLRDHLNLHCAPSFRPKRVLDAGCGTGFGFNVLSAQWPDLFETGRMICLDLAPGMLSQLPDPLKPYCMVGDMEALPIPEQTIDLYWSSLAAQWCEISTVLNEAQRVLKPHGILALATLGAETFNEMRYAFQSVDHYSHTLRFTPIIDIQKAAEAAGFNQIIITKKMITVYFPDIIHLLESVRGIGANQLGQQRRQGLMGRRSWQKVQEAYSTLTTDAGLPLSYEVILLHGICN